MFKTNEYKILYLLNRFYLINSICSLKNNSSIENNTIWYLIVNRMNTYEGVVV